MFPPGTGSNGGIPRWVSPGIQATQLLEIGLNLTPGQLGKLEIVVFSMRYIPLKSLAFDTCH